MMSAWEGGGGGVMELMLVDFSMFYLRLELAPPQF